ncbi:MAG: tetratricopeptide repeat protein [Urechidicola sp.]|nr:tetratricopeptide repeat protein [Urechidicola sp.]
MVKTKTIISILFLALVSCNFNSYEELYSQAYELEEKGEYKKAIAIHNKILARNPHFRPSLINRGADKSTLGDFKGAIEDYKKILKFDSDNLLALMNIGNNYENLNDFNSSISYYSKALNSKELIKSGKINTRIELIEDFDKDYQYRVEEYEVLFERGTAFIHNNEFEKAILDLKKLIETGQMVGDAYFYIGESYLKMNDSLNACRYFKLSLENGISTAKEKIRTGGTDAKLKFNHRNRKTFNSSIYYE